MAASTAACGGAAHLGVTSCRVRPGVFDMDRQARSAPLGGPKMRHMTAIFIGMDGYASPGAGGRAGGMIDAQPRLRLEASGGFDGLNAHAAAGPFSRRPVRRWAAVQRGPFRAARGPRRRIRRGAPSYAAAPPVAPRCRRRGRGGQWRCGAAAAGCTGRRATIAPGISALGPAGRQAACRAAADGPSVLHSWLDRAGLPGPAPLAAPRGPAPPSRQSSCRLSA